MAVRYLDYNGLLYFWGKIKTYITSVLSGKADVNHTHNYAGSQTAGGTADKAASIPFANVDSTSTTTAFTATVDGITELREGVCCYLRNGVVTSADGWTLDVNGLGAKPVYSSLAAALRTTTTFNINYAILFVYNEDRVDGGCWDIFDVYDKIPTKVSDLTNDSGFMTGMTILSYGKSTWQDFLDAYSANKVVYCRASSNSNPASGPQTRLAFMAYVNNETTPTEVEFQYYRSVSSHSDNQQGDQVYVYKINQAGTWSVTTRNAFTKINTGGDLTKSYSGGTLTISATIPTVPTDVSAFVNDAGYLTSFTETDPTVPSWAKQSTKPSYTYNEISGTPTLATVATSGDYDDLTNKPTTITTAFIDTLTAS